MNQRNAKPICALLLLPLLLSLTACGTISTPPVRSLVSYPEMPPLSEPLPLVPYSLSAQRDIKTWRNAVTGTQTISGP